MVEDELDRWRLCDELTVAQASLLVAGHDPSGVADYVEGWANKPSGYEAAKTAIAHALLGGRIKGTCRPYREQVSFDEFVGVEGTLDITTSTVMVDSLKAFLVSGGMKEGFFFAEETTQPDYLDPHHPRFAPKLAAAVKAWLSMGESATASAKSPKQLLTMWLREHAAEFGLTNDDGKPNNTGIEEVAKVANWKPEGGAPRTVAGTQRLV